MSTTETKPFLLTDEAVVKVGELLKAEGDPALGLRIAVRPGGCSGFQYEMFFDAEIAEDDVRVNYGDFDVVMDPASSPLLQGATLKFNDGLQGAGFTIDNPNASRTCGCGSSFS